MKLRRKHKFAAEVATSSLNDIMFFLLLFFLIISTVANPNVIKLLLPSAAASQQLSKKQVTLSVDANKGYFIDKRPVDPGQFRKRTENHYGGHCRANRRGSFRQNPYCAGLGGRTPNRCQTEHQNGDGDVKIASL